MAERSATVIREHIERHLSPAEARAYVNAPITAFEREEVLALRRWFCARYPTPLARLTYVRQAYARWQRVATDRALG